jgi:hypothetical protein
MTFIDVLIKFVRGECFPFAPSIHCASAALMEQLANPLSQQAGKWLVIGTNGKCIEPWISDLISIS